MKAHIASQTTDASPRFNAHTHVLDELRWLNRILSAQILRLRHANFYDSIKDWRGFFTSEEEIDALLAAGIFEKEETARKDKAEKLVAQLLLQAQEIRNKISAQCLQAEAEGNFLPLSHLAKSFRLGAFEQQALSICLAPHLDARYEKLYAYAQNDMTKRFASVDLILSLLCQSPEERLRRLPYFQAGAPLRRFELLESVDHEAGVSAGQRFLKVNSRIVASALGNQLVDERLLHELHFFPPLSWEMIVAQTALRERLQKLFETAIAQAHPVFYFYGREGVGKKTLARALCSEHGFVLASVDLRALLKTPESFREKVRLVLREGLLQPAAIYFEHFEKLENAGEEAPLLLNQLVQEINELGGITFLSGATPPPSALLELVAIYPLEIPAPNAEEQRALWQMSVQKNWPQREGIDVVALAERFDLTAKQIARAVHLAKQTAYVNAPENSLPGLSDFLKSSRVQSQPKLSALARKIEPKYSWPDLVLPEDQMLQLRELTEQVQHRQTVMAEWGFAQKLSLGRGLNALFSGSSGTGKTMAAEVIAHELGLDLYKIDLSAVVSKYIGETEKNLSRIFEEAQHSNAVLFFDEADALFGKRSEVKDAHDRYANLEIAYLLQRMEEYEGIVILATNLGKNLDEAFVRRLQYFIEFPFPDAEHREQIWRAIFPARTPLSENIDFEALALKYKITGGNIKNIGVKAAYCAAADGKVVTRQHLLHATRRELQKMGKPYMEIEGE